MEEVLITAVIFFAIYHITKLISDHLLKRKIIKAGHLEKAQILEPIKIESEEVNRYPSLKWGLVALLGGLGLILIDIIRGINPDLINYKNAVMPIGIVLVFVSLGFLSYFFIVNHKNKK